MKPNAALDALADEHRMWLAAFDPRHLMNWEKLRSADYEPAMTEAAVRRILQRNGIVVEPNEDLTGAQQRPDFRCCAGPARFYVEATCISIDKATAETEISEEPQEASFYRPLNDAIFRACRGKARQCASADAATLVAVGTFHGFAALACFDKVLLGMMLTGEAMITWNISVRTGRAVGEPCQTTKLRSAAFLRPDRADGIGSARNSISGLLLCGVGFEPPRTIGVVHPDPARPFNPALLPDIEFGELRLDRGSGQMQVVWPRGDAD